MSQGLQVSTSTVILLEAEPSLRRLITLGLRHQGLHVVDAPSLSELPVTEIAAADLLVMDIDSDFHCDWPLLETVQQHPQLAMLPSVVLSWEMPGMPQSVHPVVNASCFTFLPKPFDARAMQQKISELLLTRLSEKNAALARAEAALLAPGKRSGASIWPLVTALGLLFVVFGFLFQIAVAVLGLVIVATGLLLWMLGAQTSATHEIAPASPA
jgi:CheY-like chemotaxis protein